MIDCLFFLPFDQQTENHKFEFTFIKEKQKPISRASLIPDSDKLTLSDGREVWRYHQRDHDGQPVRDLIGGLDEDDGEADGHPDDASQEGGGSDERERPRVDLHSQFPDRTDPQKQSGSADAQNPGRQELLSLFKDTGTTSEVRKCFTVHVNAVQGSRSL